MSSPVQSSLLVAGQRQQETSGQDALVTEKRAFLILLMSSHEQQETERGEKPQVQVYCSECYHIHHRVHSHCPRLSKTQFNRTVRYIHVSTCACLSVMCQTESHSRHLFLGVGSSLPFNLDFKLFLALTTYGMEVRLKGLGLPRSASSCGRGMPSLSQCR